MPTFFVFLISVFSILPNTGNLIIRFDKPVNQGNLLVFVYDKADGFPKNKEMIYRKEIIKCKQTRQINISKLPFKTYAIVVVHDINDNQKMDRNWVGFPAEPYAISGTKSFRFGPPLYKDAQFDFKSDKQIIDLSF